MPDHPIDATAFAELLETIGGDREFLADLVGTYLADSPVQFAALRAAIADGEAAGARRAAHSLKSTSASMGAQRLSDICRRIEAACAADAVGDLAGLDAIVDEAAAEYALVEAALGATVTVGEAS
jgi:HPt (histidine-containing phosphotransfer) domain-containing protein